MIDETLVDTDVLLKTVSYRLAGVSLTQLAKRGMPPKVLGAARFMLASHIDKARRIANPAAAAAELASIEPMLVDIEPTAPEASLAAEIEALALDVGVAIHGGESQLLAMLITRSTRLMLSGDKRAIEAIASLVSPVPPNRVACLEQLLSCLVEVLGPEAVHAAVCAEPAVDKAITAACGCSSPPNTDPRPGLASYVEHLRARAPGLLCPGAGLPA